MFSKLKSRTIKLYNFLFANKKQSALFVFLVVFGLGIYSILGAHVVLATDPTTIDQGFFMSAVTKMLLSGASLMIKLAVFCLSFIIEIAGYNGYLNSTAVQVGWVMVRDIANMFFVVVLLLVAFGTILGLEQYEWKKMLVKFFFAAILVNFSRVICGLIIDVGQVVMITFVNGVAATAGGNLINAFNLTDILKMSQNSNAVSDTDPKEIFAAAVGAITFSALTLGIMLVFVFMLLSRMLVLWVLIILSPFAFVLSVVPQTEKYASQWWSEFGNHIIVGPVVVFFLWLSFAVVGNGQINSEIESNNSAPAANMPSKGAASAGISAAMSFDKIANFAIAIGILMVGAKTAQSLGTVGGSAMSKATDFAKKVATVGSGVAAGVWTANKAKEGGIGLAKLAGKGLYNATLSNTVEEVKMWGQRQLEGYRDWRAAGPRPKLDKNGNIIPGEFEKEKQGGILTRYIRGRQASLIASEKMLEKVKNQRTIREDLLKARAGATPKYLMQAFEGPEIRDLDRMEQGELDEEKARSAAKTAQFKAIGREMVLSSDRFKKGRWETKEEMGDKYRGTVAEQIAVHKEEAAASEARIKSLFSTAKETFVSGKKGKSIVTARIQAELSAKNADEASHLVEGGQKLHLIRDKAEGIELLRRQTELAAEAKKEKALTEEVEIEASRVFEGGREGKGIRKDVLRSEQAKVAAENAIKIMKGHDLAHAFQEAADEMARIIKQGGPDMVARLNTASERNDYIKSLRSATLLKEDERAEHLSQTRAEEKARAGWYEIPKLGYASPSQAMDQMIEETGKRLKSMEAQDGGAMAAMQIAHILRLKQTPGAEISDEQQAALFSSVAHITKEAWTDDTIAEISALFKDLREGKIDDVEKASNVRAMEDIFVDQLGLINRGADGSYHSVSNQENAAALQNLVVTGGDVGMVKANQKIDAALQRVQSQGNGGVIRVNGENGQVFSLTNKSNYEDVAKALGGKSLAQGGLGMSFDEFKTNLQKSQNLIQEGAATFKRAALDAGHAQMGGHQVYDRSMGMYRLNTLDGAMGWMVTELGKRKGIESAQIHSFGTINNENGKLEAINVGLMRALCANVTTARQAGFVSRTTDKLSGYGIGEQEAMHTEGDKSYGLIGGGKDYSGTAEARRQFTNVILGEIEANSEAAKIAWAKKMKINNDLVDRGEVKFAFKLENGDIVKGDKYSEFLTDLKAKLGTQLTVAQQAMLDKAVATSLSKERGPRGGGGDGQD